MTEQRRSSGPAPPGSRHQQKLAEPRILVIVIIVLVPDVLFGATPASQPDACDDPTRTATRRRQQEQPAELVIVVFVIAELVIDVRLAVPARGDTEKGCATPATLGGGYQQQPTKLCIFASVIVVVFDVVVAQLFRDGQLSKALPSAAARCKRQLSDVPAFDFVFVLFAHGVPSCVAPLLASSSAM